MIAAVLLGFVVAATGGAAAADAESDGSGEVAAVQEPQLPSYDVTIEGVDDSGLLELLERSSETYQLRDSPPATVFGLDRRAASDLERFDAVLRSESFYDYQLAYDVDDNASPPKVVFHVEPGPTYLLTRVDVAWSGPYFPPDGAQRFAKSLDFHFGKPARATAIVAGDRRITDQLGNLGRPTPGPIDRVVTVDHRDRSVVVDYTIDPGPEAAFGPLTIIGLTKTNESYVRSLIPWHEGDRYDERKVVAFRTRLLRTGLFDTVVIDHAEQVSPDGRIDQVMTVVEGDKRSIGVGGKYALSEGPAIELSWEHRSLFGNNEDLLIATELGFITQSASVDFTKPDFGQVDRDFLLGSEVKHTNSEAYNELGIEASSGVRWPVLKRWRLTTLGSVEFSELKDDQSTNKSLLFGTPLSLQYDGTNDRLNPIQGERLVISTTPYTGRYRGTTTFVVNEVGGSAYRPIPGTKHWVIGAVRTKVASIAGESRDGVPPNKREYAGGGGSIRGYKFQKVGPLDENNDPLGGRSLVEMSAELRIKVWGNLSVVPFVDGGTVYDNVLPDGSEPIRWAAGGGLRYLTAVGPARFDIAFPINPRSGGIDDPFQFYIGLGQAF